MSNPYAVDGLCHNAEAGTYNGECGKPATWTATTARGWSMGFCEHCKEHGRERHGFVRWKREGLSSAQPAVAPTRAASGPSPANPDAGRRTTP